MKRSIISLLLLFCFISSWAQINDTYWREDKTGDWLLGITDKNIIYNCKIWDISSMNEKKGSFSITAISNGQQLALNISKEKDSQRTITINKQKHVCSLITSEFLPDYPEKDTRKDFADNHYCKGDSVTIVGWIRNIPAEEKDNYEKFGLCYTGNFAPDMVISSAEMDSLGRFILRMPVENSVFCYNGLYKVGFLVEPNETYFLLRDMKTNQTLFMGNNARIINETNQYRVYPKNEYSSEERGLDPTAFFEKKDKEKNIAMQQLDSICNEHPTLSTRFRKFWHNNILSISGYYLMSQNYEYEYDNQCLNIIAEEYLNKIQPPYVAEAFHTFLRDYSNAIENMLRSKDKGMKKWLLYSADKDGVIKLSDKDKEDIEKYFMFIEKMENATDSVAIETLITEFKPGTLLETVGPLMNNEKMLGYWMKKHHERDIELMLEEMKSLGWSKTIQDMYLCQKIIRKIDENKIPLTPEELAFCDENIQLQIAKDYVHEINDKFEAINKLELSGDNLKSNYIVKDMSEGSQIFSKLIEPYKGKIILIDVWGTWCGPCKQALSHSQEEYEHLKPYDMVFMYLANRSPEETWKNVIKEYNVVGDNVVHFNLPANQQKAVEEYLKVGYYPTYRLVDQNGNLLDVDVNVLNLYGTENLIKKLTGKQ